MSAFEELGLCPEIIKAVEEDDWLLPTPVQQEAVPLILTGGDVLAAAETGSGKTGAFGLPCLQIVHEQLRGKCQTRDSASTDLRCELNVEDKDASVKLGDDLLEVKSTDDSRWSGIRASIEVVQGKYMFEVEAVDGLLRVGWSSGCSRLELGTEDRSFGYGSTGKKSSARKFEDYGEAFKAGDIIGCLLDQEDRNISFFKNGKSLGVAYTLEGEFGLKPHICGKGFGAVAKFDGPMEYPVEGYAAIGEADPAHIRRGMTQVASGRAPMCMILEPTRDLAEQTFKCMVKFNKYLEEPKMKIALLVGGMDEQEMLRKLEQGLDVVIGTLQKTMDLVRRGKLDVSQIRFFVLDEADDLQKKDDRQDIPQLNSQIKKGRKDRVQTLLFSATLHTPEVKQLVDEITTRAVWVDLKGQDSVPETVHHVAFLIDPKQDMTMSDETIASRAKFPNEQPVLDGVHAKPSMSEVDAEHPTALRNSQRIKTMKAKMIVKIADLFNMTQCLVFCRTNVECDNLEDYFNRLDGARRGYRGKVETGKENPYSSVVLAGNRTQKDRSRNLETFKDGDVRFLICTDVAARGIDISSLPFVIQATLSDDIENYIHRIGRCGRAERLGLAISLVATEREKVWYHKCPSRGKNCVNTKLTLPCGPDGKPRPTDRANWYVDEGGCTVWNDEPDILRQVEARIGMPMRVMDPDDFCVPGVIESPLPVELRKKREEDEADKEALSRRALKRKKEEPQAVVYGAKKNDAKATVAAKQLQTILPAVGELGALERKIQQIFARALYGVAASADSAGQPGLKASDILTVPVGASAPLQLQPAGQQGGQSEPGRATKGWASNTERPKKKVRW